MKRLALALTVTAVALTLTACGGTGSNTDVQMSNCRTWVAQNHPTDSDTATQICVKMLQKDPTAFKD